MTPAEIAQLQCRPTRSYRDQLTLLAVLAFGPVVWAVVVLAIRWLS